MLYDDLARQAATKAASIARTSGTQRPGYNGRAADLGRMVRMAEGYEGKFLLDVLAAHMTQVWPCTVLPRVLVPLHRDVRLLAAAGDDNAADSELRHVPIGRATSIDLLVPHPGSDVGFYEVKRGADGIGRDHLRQRLDNMRALQLIGRDMASTRLGRPVRNVEQYVISYYGCSNFPDQMTVNGRDLDRHFGVYLVDVIEAHLQYFRYCLDVQVPGLTGILYDGASLQTRGTGMGRAA